MAKRPGTGRPPAAVNLQLGTFLVKSPISIENTRLLFAALDCHPPNAKSLQTVIDRCCANYTTLNTEQMVENQNLLFDARGSEVKVLTDTVYNNPPKGRSMYQAGTQSHTPMIDAETGLVLAQQAYSKIGKYANMEETDPMDRSEAKAINTNIKNIEAAGKLKVTHVVSDGCTKISMDSNKSAPIKLRCSVHVSRIGPISQIYFTHAAKQN